MRRFNFRNDIKDRDKKGLVALHDSIMAEGLADMGLAYADIADQDKIGRFLDPIGLPKGQDSENR